MDLYSKFEVWNVMSSRKQVAYEATMVHKGYYTHLLVVGPIA